MPELIAEYHAEPVHVAGPRRPRLKTPIAAPSTNGTKPKLTTAARKTPKKPPRPAADHPWRKSKIGRGPRDFTPGKVKVIST